MKEASIALISKPGKDPSLPESYRPISLLQLDIKILAKVLALRLNNVILTLEMARWTILIGLERLCVRGLSLYADDMLLYLEDTGPFLAAALNLIERFSAFSGLQIN